jgi:hypothetical protein
MWRQIEGQVEEWVRANWSRWSEEQPEWFSDSWQGRVPIDWIPIQR